MKANRTTQASGMEPDKNKPTRAWWVQSVAVLFPLLLMMGRFGIETASSGNQALILLPWLSGLAAGALLLAAGGLVWLYLAERKHTCATPGVPRLFLPVLLYAMFAMLSTAASEHRFVSLLGMPESREGLLVILAYGFLAYTGFLWTRGEREAERLSAVLLVGGAGMGLIPLARWLQGVAMPLELIDSGALASGSVLLLPLCWGCTLLWAERPPASGTWARFAWVASLAAALLCTLAWMGSLSWGSFHGGIPALLLFALLQAKALKKHAIQTVLLIAGTAVVLMAGGLFAKGEGTDPFSPFLPDRVWEQAIPSEIPLEMAAAEAADVSDPERASDAPDFLEAPWPVSYGFEGREALMDNRGWVWSRTLPLLTGTLVTGHGPDTFSLVFPQEEPAWKQVLFGKATHVVKSPRSMYLQTALQTGVVSLMMLLWFLGALLLESLRARFGRPVSRLDALFGADVPGAMAATTSTQSKGKRIRAWKATRKRMPMTQQLLLSGLLCGVMGYAISGLFHDSTLWVAPAFWLMTGLCAGLLRTSIRRTKHPVSSTT